ncbi:MAG: stage III sporulation protein AC [Clostridia bacterium]|nr:stage III sporulation protein AC [Clostridia bacterium]
MELDLIFKIAAIGIIIAILNQLLTKSDKGEYATLTTIAGIIIVLLMIIPHIEDLFKSIREIIDF